MPTTPKDGQEARCGSDRSDRVRRACDRCNTSRTRCTGEIPCRRCFKLNYDCQFERTVKKRGPKPKYKGKVRHPGPDCPSRRDYDRASCSGESTSSANSEHKTSLPSTPEVDGESAVSSSAWTGEISSSIDLSSSNLYLDTDLFDHDSITNSALGLSPWPIETLPIATDCDSDNEVLECRYPCLNPILKYLKDILRPEEACDLLDIFFAEPGASRNCPYVLSPVIRKESLLRRHNPRRTSPALLAIILWCVSHTAKLAIFADTAVRTRVTQRLYFLSMKLLQVPASKSGHLDPGGRSLRADIPLQTGFVNDVFSPQSKEEPDVDDVLGFVLLTCVISGSEFREDCLSWWNKAVHLVKKLGYNSEARITLHTPCSQQMSRAAREDHEERRRAFWLVYALDRHLSLLFNEPLQIHDVECQVLSPLPEYIWQSLDTFPLQDFPPRVCGPTTLISGTGFFDYFLPLMTILGDILEFGSQSQQPPLGFDETYLLGAIEGTLADCQYSLDVLRAGRIIGPSNAWLLDGSDIRQMELVIAYSQHVIRVLYILLYGNHDARLSLDNSWASNTIAAVDSVGQIMELDEDLSFMPFLFGVYLFHGGLSFMSLPDCMLQAGVHVSLHQTFNVINRAHKLVLEALDTSFQRKFSRVARQYNSMTEDLAITGIPIQPYDRPEVNTSVQEILY
ncbi:fungal-specific transcription factor domain-containing protein [Aspergillus californicus]